MSKAGRYDLRSPIIFGRPVRVGRRFVFSGTKFIKALDCAGLTEDGEVLPLKHSARRATIGNSLDMVADDTHQDLRENLQIGTTISPHILHQ